MHMMSVNATDNTANNDDTLSCPGIATRRTCYLRPAVVRYSAQILDYSGDSSSSTDSSGNQNIPSYITLPRYDGISFNDTSAYDSLVKQQQQQQGNSVISYKDIYESHQSSTDSYESRLSSIQEVLNNQLAGYANISWTSGLGFISTQTGSALTQISQSTDEHLTMRVHV